MKSKRATALIFVVVLGLLLPASSAAQFTALPDGFEDQLVVSGVPAPTAIDRLPNGDILIATQGGIVFRWSGVGAAQPILDLSGAVCLGGEMGLLGLAVDPAFAGNPFIYLYYTHRGAGVDGCDAANRANRVSRFPVDGNGTIGTELVLIDNIAAPGGNHNAGDLQFDRNHLLYVSVGDGGSTPETARRLDTLNGKILRITRDGAIPASNPFTGAGTESCRLAGDSPTGLTCREIFATGLRNPFRIAFDPDDPSGQQFFINDVGGGAWEEVDAGVPGADYGWNIREGPCLRGSTTNCPQPSGFVEPIHAYQHQTGCRTITGGAFVRDSTNWPAKFRDDYLFADLACETLFAFDTASRTATVFATGSGAIQLRFFNAGALLYTTYERGGEVRSIVSTVSPGGTTSPPTETSPTAREKRRACKKYKKKGKDRKAKKLGCKKSNDRDGRNHKKRR